MSYRGEGLTYGVDGTNAGIIYAGTGSATAGVPQTTIDLAIAAGAGQTQMLVRPVPVGKQMYVEAIHASVAGVQSLDAELSVRAFGSGFAVKWNESIYNDSISRENLWLGPYAEKSDVEMRGTAGGATTAITAGFKYHLISYP